MKKKRKKGKFILIIEYAAVYSIMLFSNLVSLRIIYMISWCLGNMLYLLVARRRKIALENLRNALLNEPERQIRKIARKSCQSFFLTFLESAKSFHLLTAPNALDKIRNTAEDLEELFLKAKRIHDESKGCIFVTPHLGNWELLPYVSSVVGIPLVVVVRPLDNLYLEKLFYAKRSASGQIIIPKRNAFFVLQETLQQGKSIGMLPDQSTMKGVSVNFFGRKATTTPVPAILAIARKRPIVVVACCRRNDYRFEGFVSDPIWSEAYTSEKAEIFRLTEEMNRQMESIIRKYPEQYLWMHNRWKTYQGKKDFMA